MPIRDVRRYADLVRAGDGNEAERLELLRAHRAGGAGPARRGAGPPRRDRLQDRPLRGPAGRRRARRLTGLTGLTWSALQGVQWTAWHFTRRTLGTTVRPRGLRARPRLHGDVGVLRHHRRADRHRHHPPRPRPRASPSSTPPTCTARSPTSSWSARRSQGRRDEVQLATKFGNERNPDGSWVGINGTPDYVRARLRRLAAAARRGPHRPLLPAPRRPDRPDRGDGRRDEGAGRGRQGPPPRPLRGRGRHDPPRARRAPDHRAAERVLAVHPRPRGRDPADHPRARHRPGALLPAGPRHPHRRRHQGVARRRRLPGHRLLPPVPGRRARRQPRAGRQGQGARRPSTAARRASSRWPGCWPRATTSRRSRAPSGSPTWRRTSAPPPSS